MRWLLLQMKIVIASVVLSLLAVALACGSRDQQSSANTDDVAGKYELLRTPDLRAMFERSAELGTIDPAEKRKFVEERLSALFATLILSSDGRFTLRHNLHSVANDVEGTWTATPGAVKLMNPGVKAPMELRRVRGEIVLFESVHGTGDLPVEFPEIRLGKVR